MIAAAVISNEFYQTHQRSIIWGLQICWRKKIKHLNFIPWASRIIRKNQLLITHSNHQQIFLFSRSSCRETDLQLTARPWRCSRLASYIFQIPEFQFSKFDPQFEYFCFWIIVQFYSNRSEPRRVISSSRRRSTPLPSSSVPCLRTLCDSFNFVLSCFRFW